MKKGQQGFTLIEIILSLFVGLVLFAGIMSVFVGMRTTTQETNSLGVLQENGRFALSVLSEDLMRQSFWGDLAVKPDSIKTPGLGLPAFPIAGDCIGGGFNNASFPQNGIGDFKTLWGVTVLAANPNPVNCINNARPASDIIQLKRVLSRPLPPQADGTPSNPADNRYWLNASMNNGIIFPGTLVVPTINSSRLWEYQHHVYYVTDELQGNGTVPVLMQGTLINGGVNLINFQPLIEGIEVIHFMYGVDTTNDGNVNAYVSAGVMSNNNYWNTSNVTVKAVKVYVLARDILPDNDFTNNRTYLLGDLVVVANDNFRRLLLASTVTLHNSGVKSWIIP